MPFKASIYSAIIFPVNCNYTETIVMTVWDTFFHVVCMYAHRPHDSLATSFINKDFIDGIHLDFLLIFSLTYTI